MPDTHVEFHVAASATVQRARQQTSRRDQPTRSREWLRGRVKKGAHDEGHPLAGRGRDARARGRQAPTVRPPRARQQVSRRGIAGALSPELYKYAEVARQTCRARSGGWTPDVLRRET
eukprot:3385849-Pleurochrysis_carterae.AAC.1